MRVPVMMAPGITAGTIDLFGCRLPAVVVPELFRTTGGVQVFSRCFILALDELFGRPVPVISRNDRTSDCPPGFLEQRKFNGCGNLPPSLRRFSLIQACLGSGAPSFLATHPHFTPWLRYQRRLFQQPYLSVAHGIDVWNLGSRSLVNGIEKAECILPVSRFTEARLREQLGGAMPPVEIFPNTFDEDRFRPGMPATAWRERLGIPESGKIVLSVCRVSSGESAKGYDKVLEALPELLGRHPELTWVLGGQGDDLARVQEKAALLGVADRCRFPGFIADAELPDLYRVADLFVLPSKKEGFGIVFIEAAACGLPLIAGNQDGSVDALDDGALGLLIDPDDPVQLVDAIERTLRNPAPDKVALHHACVDRFGRDAFRERLRAIFLKYPRLLGL